MTKSIIRAIQLSEEMKMKTLKECLKSHEIESVSYMGSEILSVPNIHGQWEDKEGNKVDRYEFFVKNNKIFIEKLSIGSYQCYPVPWKGERPEDMSFEYYRR
jgi:hypothetical protein